MAPAQVEDNALIQRSLAGDAESFAQLVNRHSGYVHRQIRGILRNHPDAGDLLQDVFLKVRSRLASFRAESTFRTWMTLVAVNQTLMLIRREQCRPRCQPLDNVHRLVCPGELTDQSLMRSEEAHGLRRAVWRLPCIYRSVVTLHDLDQLSLKETARRVKATIPAVKSRLFRGRQMLQAAIQNSGVRRLAA
jgi:RNA polymerase sigma-70 factor, ECF subfamily